MHVLRRLWKEEDGFLASIDYTLISTLLLIATIAGAVTFRDALVQELGDLGLAIGFLNQSYGFSGATVGAFNSASSLYNDNLDNCVAADPANNPPACMNVSQPASTSG
jgi:Flp pilus assembly pilin Flp